MASVRGFDERILQFFDDHRRGWLEGIAQGAMALGEPAAMVGIGALVMVALVALRRWRLVIALPVAAVGALTAARIGKEIVGRDRPPLRLATVYTDGSAFPSTSATLTMAVMAAVFVLAVAPRRGRGLLLGSVLCAAPVLLSGWAVMYLGAHWPTDVLAGWMLGSVVGVAAAAFSLGTIAVLERIALATSFPPTPDTQI